VATVPAQGAAFLGPDGLPAVKRVLVAVDLSEAAGWAVAFGYALLARGGGDVVLLHVVHPPGPEEGRAAVDVELAARLRALVPRAAGQGDVGTHVEIARGPVVREICAAAERLGADVVCLASRGDAGVVKAALGSVVAGVLGESTRPVLVVHPPPP
jgi:nucleotide-binding universal stress UspA family protein